jgi:MarR-like DNA-binding transcriptional regulator SgrR of sgrS sRNA
MNMYEPLVRRDRNLKLEQGLATEWSNTDPTTWRFKLLHDVKFHDGTPLTAMTSSSLSSVRSRRAPMSRLCWRQ